MGWMKVEIHPLREVEKMGWIKVGTGQNICFVNTDHVVAVEVWSHGSGEDELYRLIVRTSLGAEYVLGGLMTKQELSRQLESLEKWLAFGARVGAGIYEPEQAAPAVRELLE